MLTSSQYGPRRKHRSSVAVQSLLSDGMMYSIVACTSIDTDCTENTIPLLFMGHCQVVAGCYDSTILASSKYATVCSRNGLLQRPSWNGGGTRSELCDKCFNTYHWLSCNYSYSCTSVRIGHVLQPSIRSPGWISLILVPFTCKSWTTEQTHTPEHVFSSTTILVDLPDVNNW
jgi:hypothetical protein